MGLLNPLLGTRKRQKSLFLVSILLFLYRSKNHFSSYLFCQRLLVILYSGLSFGLPLLRFGRGSGQTEGKKVWRGTNFLRANGIA